MARYRVPSGQVSLVHQVAAAGVMLSASQRRGVSSQGFLGPRLFPGPRPGLRRAGPGVCFGEELGGSVWTEPPPLHSMPPGLRAKGGFGVVSIHCAGAPAAP